MATSKNSEGQFHGATPQQPALRRSKSRLPLSKVAASPKSSATRGSTFAEGRANVPVSRKSLEHDSSKDSRATSRTVPASSSQSSRSVSSTRTRAAAKPQSSSSATGTNKSISPLQPRGSRLPTVSPKTSLPASEPSLLLSGSPRPPLRRKAYDIDEHAPRVRSDTSGRQGHQNYNPSSLKVDGDDPFPSAVLGITLPPTGVDGGRDRTTHGESGRTRPQVPPVKIDEETKRLNIAQATGHESSAASSFRHSESPFSFLSTPTSASSYSPVMTQGRHLGRHAVNANIGDERHSIDRVEASKDLSAADYPPKHATSTAKQDQTRLTDRRDREAGSTHDAHHGRAPGQIPPELAHLNVEPAPVLSNSSRIPPRRPSRDVTPDLGSQHMASPVIHSDMPALFTSLPPRKPSVETPLSAKSPSSTSRRRFRLPSRNSSRHQSPKVESAMSPSSQYFERTPSTISCDDTDMIRQDSPMFAFTSSPERSSRFGFLSKQPREMIAPADKVERARRRGPAAGTGHEGYSRLGFRGRSAGSIFGGTFGRSPSADSMASTGKKSMFGWKRTQTGDEATNPDDLIYDGARSFRSDETVRPQTPQYDQRQLYEPDISPRSKPKRDSMSLKASEPSPNQWRSVQSDKEEANMDRMDNPARHANTGRIQTRTPSNVSPAKKAGSNAYKEGWRGDHSHHDKQDSHQKTSALSNFAQRLFFTGSRQDVQPDKEESQTSVFEDLQQNHAHYLLSSVVPSVSTNDVQRLVDTPSPNVKTATKELKAPRVPFESRHEGLMPSPILSSKYIDSKPTTNLPDILTWGGSTASPKLLKAQTATSARSPQLVDIPSSPATARPQGMPAPRLSPVGRIPRVVSSRDQDRRLPERSFSRPFVATQPRPTNHTELDNAAAAHNNKYAKSREWTSKENETLSGVRNGKNVRPDDHNGVQTEEPFIAFPPRQNSDLSYTSSSGKASPGVSHIRLAPSMEDTWSEYNDLFEEFKSSSGARSSSEANKSTGEQRLELPSRIRRSIRNIATNRPQASTETIHSAYRTSRSVQSTTAPSTPFTISDYLEEGDRTSKTSNVARQSVPEHDDDPERDIPRENEAAKPDVRREDEAAKPAVSPMSKSGAELPRARKREPNASDTSIATSSSRAGVHHATGEFRHASLVTSKWLSFGRVLFSPVHDEAKAGNDARVLVLDGLGTEWAYYCALNYPGCQFYHLGPEPSTSPNEAVPNYRHIHHSSLSAAFPFPRGFFAGVVLRFPRVTSDEGYQTCVSEIKRTLRPGGYLEMSTIDLDLMNMGSRTRKAIKDLKVLLHQSDDQLSLWNQGDAFLKLLGRRGFEGIQRCVVALPAAGRVARSQDSTTSSNGSSPYPGGVGHAAHEAEGLGLADLLRKNSNDSQLDEQITKTVARVGRWWYSMCYEEAIEVDDNDNNETDATDRRAFWTTSGLLREMARQGTSLRLSICYAQKPDCAKRRTASV